MDLAIALQRLTQNFYEKPILGMEQRCTREQMWSVLIHHATDELYKQMHCMNAYIIQKTGMLLGMYAQAAFTNAAYFQLS